MDKHTLSHYGWIVIVVLVISVIVAVATPFGDLMATSAIQMVKDSNEILIKQTGEVYDENVKYYQDLMNKNTVQYKEPGLYRQLNSEEFSTMVESWENLTKSMDVLVNGKPQKIKLISFANNTLLTQYDKKNNVNLSSNFLDGDLVIKSGALKLGDYAFAGCKKLKTVTIKDTQVIQTNAFKDCTALEALIFDDTNLSYIMEDAFVNCPKLKYIVYHGTMDEFKKVAFAKQSISQPLTIICMDGTMTANVSK